MTDETKTDPTKGDEAKEKRRKLLGIAPIETHHELVAGGKTLKYTARAGVLPLKDEFDETEAEIFFMAYELDGVKDRSTRPLTFAFNGGPGSSSIWLHMGALGPKRVVMESEGWMPKPPFRYEDNALSWLDQTDLVFIDPVGTGYSRAAREDRDKKFWSYKGDIESVGQFIRLYLSRYTRWTSPLFLAGESYGTTRAAGLAGYLIDQGVAFNGIFLISSALDFQSFHFGRANDLPYALFVPTYTATAWYHKRLSLALQAKPIASLMAEVKTWAETKLAPALMKGDRIDDAEKRSVARKLAEYTGLSVDYIVGTNLRVDIFRFCKELLRDERRSVGRIDSRFEGVEALAVTERPEFDASIVAITPPYSAALNHYVRAELGIETDLVYEVMPGKVNEKWQWENGELPATSEEVRIALAKNPHMKVLFAQGYYDLATPLFATEYMISHMNADPKLRGNIDIVYYESGHMFYLEVGCLKAFKDDITGFIVKAR